MKLKSLNVLFLPAILSCSPAAYPEPENPEIPFTEIIQSSDFFPETDEPGKYEFYTNDTAYIKPYGMTFWATVLEDQPVFDRIDVSLAKVSGNAYAGYGVVFCQGMRGEQVEETMLVFMINLNQEYIIGEVVKDRFSVIVPWTSYLGLNSGYNQEDRIRICFDPVNEEFQLYINNMDEILRTFKDDDAPVHRSGSGGFLAVISPRDKFPEIPVHVIYKNNL